MISRKFARELADKEMRDAYLAAQTRTKLANQIRAIRTQRGWSQDEFAKVIGKPQSNISRLESRDYGSYTLNTRLALAEAFDVGLTVEFVAYEKFLNRTQDLSSAALEVPAFREDALSSLYDTKQARSLSDLVNQDAKLKKDLSRPLATQCTSIWDDYGSSFSRHPPNTSGVSACGGEIGNDDVTRRRTLYKALPFLEQMGNSASDAGTAVYGNSGGSQSSRMGDHKRALGIQGANTIGAMT